jgi:hypothetical protein
MDYGYCEPTTNSVEQDAVEALSSLPDHPLSPSNDYSECEVCKK